MSCRGHVRPRLRRRPKPTFRSSKPARSSVSEWAALSPKGYQYHRAWQEARASVAQPPHNSQILLPPPAPPPPSPPSRAHRLSSRVAVRTPRIQCTAGRPERAEWPRDRCHQPRAGRPTAEWTGNSPAVDTRATSERRKARIVEALSAAEKVKVVGSSSSAYVDVCGVR